MVVDEQVLERVRRTLAGRPDVLERRMMGVTCFMVGNVMCCGVNGQALMMRVGREAYREALAEPHVRPLVVGKRRPAGFVLVDRWVPDGSGTVNLDCARVGDRVANRSRRNQKGKASDEACAVRAAIGREPCCPATPATVGICRSPSRFVYGQTGISNAFWPILAVDRAGSPPASFHNHFGCPVLAEAVRVTVRRQQACHG